MFIRWFFNDNAKRALLVGTRLGWDACPKNSVVFAVRQGLTGCTHIELIRRTVLIMFHVHHDDYEIKFSDKAHTTTTTTTTTKTL